MAPVARRISALLLAAVLSALAPAAAQESGRPSTEAPVPQEDGADVVLGRRSDIRLPAAPAETILVGAGTRLYALPDRRSALLTIVGAEAPRPVLERAAGWAKVRVDGRGGWAAVAGGRSGPEIEAPPDLDYLAIRQQPLAPLAERLARARALLGPGAEREVGPFRLYTDLADDAAVDLIANLMAQFPTVYAERYGLEPAERDRFAVVVFAAEAAYRVFERDDRELADLEAAGHAAGNIAAIYAEGRQGEELAPILLHELTHLVNQSVFRGNLAPSLEEGMAEDLSFVHVDSSGRLDPARLGGVDRRYLELADDGSTTRVTELWGAPATLSRLVEALRQDRLMELPVLLSLSRHQMTKLEGRPLRYGQSAFLVRYLLEGAGSGGRAGLRRFLRRAAEGGGSEPDELATFVERDWERLTRGYERWLVARERRLAAAG